MDPLYADECVHSFEAVLEDNNVYCPKCSSPALAVDRAFEGGESGIIECDDCHWRGRYPFGKRAQALLERRKGARK